MMTTGTGAGAPGGGNGAQPPLAASTSADAASDHQDGDQNRQQEELRQKAEAFLKNGHDSELGRTTPAEMKAISKKLDDKVLAFEVTIKLLEAREEAHEASEKARKASEKALKNNSLERLKVAGVHLLDRTQSGSHLDPEYTPANFQEFHSNDFSKHLNAMMERLDEDDGKFWKTPMFFEVKETIEAGVLERIGVNSEVEVVFFVRAVLGAVIQGLGLDQHLTIAMNRNVAGQEVDLVLLFGPLQIPCGPVEAKKPPEGSGKELDDVHKQIFGSGKVAGQHACQFAAMKTFGFGVMWGMRTTGNRWQLTSTHNKSSELKVRGVDGCKSPVAAANYNNNGTNPPSPDVSLDFARVLDWQPDTLYGSPPQFPNGETGQNMKRIVALAALFVLNTYKSVRVVYGVDARSYTIKIPKPGTECNARKLSMAVTNDPETLCAFEKFTVPNFKKTFFDKKVKYVHIIAPLGWGSTGCVCFAVAKTGVGCCAVKFFHKSERESRSKANLEDICDQELKNWKKVYEGELPECRVAHDVHGKVLVVPFMEPIPAQARKSLLEKGDIKEALTRFASKGFTHPEVFWRHFGFFGEGKERKLYLLDLGRIQESNGEEHKRAWIDSSLESLRESQGQNAGLTVSISSPSSGSGKPGKRPGPSTSSGNSGSRKRRSGLRSSKSERSQSR